MDQMEELWKNLEKRTGTPIEGLVEAAYYHRYQKPLSLEDAFGVLKTWKAEGHPPSYFVGFVEPHQEIQK